MWLMPMWLNHLCTLTASSCCSISKGELSSIGRSSYHNFSLAFSFCSFLTTLRRSRHDHVLKYCTDFLKSRKAAVNDQFGTRNK